jgi:ribosomal protein S18 acetylase RimI-like enzyme
VTLSDAEFDAVRRLAYQCETHDRITLRIGWEQLRSRVRSWATDLLALDAEQIVGFLTFDGSSTDVAEVAGMVHPDERRRGIGRALVEAARQLCRAHGTPTLLLIGDNRSASGRAFAQSLGAQLDHAEHVLRRPASAGLTMPETTLTVRLAAEPDLSVVARMIAEDFGLDPETFERRLREQPPNLQSVFYIAALAGTPVGTLNVQIVEGEPYIYGFVVQPAYRRRGYGRQFLTSILAELLEEQPRDVWLEVDPENTPALALYRSIGFEVVRTFEYWAVTV